MVKMTREFFVVLKIWFGRPVAERNVISTFTTHRKTFSFEFFGAIFFGFAVARCSAIRKNRVYSSGRLR